MAAKASPKTPPAGLDKRTADLESAIAAITKSFGEGSIMRLGDEGANLKIDAISTGSLGLDIALGVGGVPRGRIIEIYGPESSGKTTLMLHIVANAQKGGGTAAFIDAEHALDPTYARKLGVNVDELLVSQPDHGEQALEIADTLVRSGAVDIIVIDSVAALVPKAEIEYFRRVYFSMCYEADTLLGQLIDALDQSGARQQTYILMISDHGEDCTEHRQTGK